MLLRASSQLGSRQHQLALGFSTQRAVALGDALNPPFAHIGVGNSSIVRIVPNRNLTPLHIRLPQRRSPVENVVDLNALARHDSRRSTSRCWQRPQSELFVIGDYPLR